MSSRARRNCNVEMVLYMNQVSSTTVKRTRLHEQVAKALFHQIFRGEISQEDFLPNEDTLAEQFGVSKSVIREAINTLNVKGLLIAKPRVGTQVCVSANWLLNDPMLLQWRMELGPDKTLIRELLELRKLIEPMAAGLAAQRATKTDLEKIREAMILMDSATSLEKHVAGDIRFHLAIIESSGNNLLISSFRPVIEQILGSSFQLLITSFKAAKDSIPYHWDVVRAIEKKDNQTAIEAMRKVIEGSTVQ